MLAYGSTQALPFFELFHPFPVEASQPAIVAGFWIPALFPVFSLLMVYALYRFLDEDRSRDEHSAFLGFLFGAIAFPIAVVHMVIQASVHLEGSSLASSDPTFSTEMWSSVVAAVHGVDNGIDLTWDLFLVLWLVFTGVAMLGHRRFGLWWGVPAIVIGALLLAVNAITVPEPPASAGLFDPGPLAGLYALALSVYLVKLGLGDRPKHPTGEAEEAHRG
ncbi:MAG TPA: hypothetical protein VF148_13975, partial [Acidimicrobiia bacterium]